LVRLVAALVGTEVLRRLEVDRIDRFERHELVDVDARAGRGLERAQLLVGEADVLALLDLVAADELAPLDDPLVARAPDLLLDARAALAVQQIEGGGLRVGRDVEADGDRDEAETHRPRPHRARRHADQESVRAGAMSNRTGIRPPG